MVPADHLILADPVDQGILMLPAVLESLGYQMVLVNLHLHVDPEDRLVLLLQLGLEIHHFL